MNKVLGWTPVQLEGEKSRVEELMGAATHFTKEES